MFKVVDDNFTTIFNKTQNISNGFSLASNSVSSFVDEFNKLNTQQNFDSRWDSFINGAKSANGNMATYFEDLAKQGASAKASIEEVYDAILDGNTRGIGNVKSVIATFNSLNPANQKAFATAVGQSNASLGKYLSNIEIGSAKFKDYAKQIAVATAKTVGLKAVTAALNSLLTAGISMLISEGINWIINAVNSSTEAIKSAQEAAEKAKDSLSILSDYKDKVKKLREELESSTLSTEEATSKRGELLDVQRDLIKNYGIEASKINLVTGELQSQLDVINELAKSDYWKAKRLNNQGYESAVSGMKSQTLLFNGAISKPAYETYGTKDGIAYRNLINDLYSELGMKISAWSDSTLTLTGDIYTIDKALSTMYNRLSEFAGTSDNKLVDDETFDDVQNALNYISSVRNDWSNKYITDNEEIYSQWLAYESQYSDEYIDIIRERAKVDQAIQSDNNDEIIKTKNNFIAKYKELTDKATQNGDADVVGYLNSEYGAYINNIQNMGVATENVIGESERLINTLNSKLTELKETYTATLDNQDKFQTALDKIKNGTSLTSDEILGLIEIYPDLATQFSKTADGWTISSDSIISANEMVVKSTKESIQEQIDGYQKIVDKYNESKDVIPNGNSMGMPSDVLSMFSNNLAQLASDAEDAQKQIDILNLILQMFGFTTGNQTKTLADYTKELSDTKSTVEEIKNVLDNNGTLTANDLQKAIEQYPQLENSLRAYLAGLKSQEDIYNELVDCYNQDLDNFKTYLANKSIDDESTWDKFIENSGDWVNSLADMYALDLAHLKTYKQFSDELKNSISNNIPDSTAALAHYQNLERQSFEEFKGLFGDVEDIISESGDNSSSSSVTLPEEYTKLKKALEHEYAMGRKTAKEYYTELNSLAVKWLKGNAEYADEYMSVQETVYSGLKSLYSEVVNEQIEGYENVFDVLKDINQEKIDSLNKEKELLEDNADEEQRILDLKQAQLDLENAKKKTTWVITQQGLKQVQDEKSIKEAQDALDKLELESKTAQIDKKIKALEDENDEYDKLKTDWQNKTHLEEAKKFIGSDNIKGAVSEGFKEGYINALNEKQSIENFDKTTNKVSNPITIDDLLKKLGSKYTFDEIKDKAYNLAFSPYAFNSFADNVKTATENIVNNINNNSSKVGDINIVINDATDPEKVGNVVVKKLTDIATKWSNSSGRYLRSNY